MALEALTENRRTGRAPRTVRTRRALVDGTWHHDLVETPEVRRRLADAGGKFHDRVSSDGSGAYAAEAERYHLYVSYACPWAHRTIIYRRLKSLENVVSMSVLHPRWAGPDGWWFGESDLSTIDHASGRQFLYEVYRAAKPDYTGKVTVPVLWDRKRETIVNNESSEIIRMLNSAFDAWGDASVDFYPRQLRSEIDALNAWLIPGICQGVYKAGFADSQAAYERAVETLFEGLDALEERLSTQPYLLGERITECDWHLFCTLCRFDAVYFGALKCNLRRLIDYPALSAYTRRLHEVPGIADTVRFEHIKRHYFDAIGEINPTIVPSGPAVDYTTPERSRRAVERRVAREIRELHEFLESWLKGKVPIGDTGLGRLRKALAEEFFIIHPNGERDDKTGVLRNFALAYGNKPDDYHLNISDLSVRVLEENLCLATYKETHVGGYGHARTSTALLRESPLGGTIEWLYLQETPLN